MKSIYKVLERNFTSESCSSRKWNFLLFRENHIAIANVAFTFSFKSIRRNIVDCNFATTFLGPRVNVGHENTSDSSMGHRLLPSRPVGITTANFRVVYLLTYNRADKVGFSSMKLKEAKTTNTGRVFDLMQSLTRNVALVPFSYQNIFFPKLSVGPIAIQPSISQQHQSQESNSQIHTFCQFIFPNMCKQYLLT